MRTAKKIVFFGHEASRTGAPILLLHLIRWLKGNSDLQIEILLKKGGPLVDDYAALAPTTVLKLSFAGKLVRKACAWLKRRVPAMFSLRTRVIKYARRRKIDLVYANTIVVAEEVEAFSALGVPVVWHVHEMPFIIRSYGGGAAFRKASGLASAYIAASTGVKDGLVAHYSVPPQKIEVIHEFIAPGEIEAAVLKEKRASVRQELALPEDAFVAGMCGTVEWRKGPDLFITVAKHLATEFPDKNIYLLWIGARTLDLEQRAIDHDLLAAGLANRVQFIGVQIDVIGHLAALDVFALTSREDPFPLVMLEAASIALPIVCFSRSGGGPEFAETDAGIVVEYGDTLAMARALVRLSEQPALRQQLGAAAKQKVMNEYKVEIQAPKILKFIAAAAQNLRLDQHP